jgi:uncharacterized protein YcaQ
MQTLSQAAVRGLMVAAQGLQQCSTPPAPATRDDLRQMIRRLHGVQIDTIHVVARSPYLVLWSRLGDYPQRWLDELLAEGALFEYWARAASFLPIEDYPLYRRLMLERLTWHESRWRPWMDEHAALVEQVVARIREHGPVRAADLARPRAAPAGWWNWTDEKTALDGLWMRGDLMIASRQRFQRVYDLRERILPEWDDGRAPSLAAVHETFVLHTVKALGVAKATWVDDYFGLSRRAAQAALARLAERGALVAVRVEGWETPGYYHPEQRKAVAAAAIGQIPVSRTTLLSPFDPLVCDRERAQELFDFAYRIECYTPAPRRIYGYFTLPILHRNALIGRLDPKAHRKEGVFEVKALHLEPGVVVDDALVDALRGALHACAVWHETPRVVVRAATAPGLAARLSS